ncbi:TPA: hypothetical protein ACH3X2_005171 [Trebouxia sp. C0005]
MQAMAAPYQAHNGGLWTKKLEREKFVSHHSGTDLTELCALIALVPVLAFTLQWFCARQQHCRHLSVSCSWLRAFGQITWVVIPTILAVMSEWALWPLTFVLCVMTMLLVCWTVRHEHLSGLTKSLQQLAEQHRKSYITSIRGCTLVCTAICILAVDFQAFPRRYCKAEKFGHGLMDLGVGSFVFSSSVASRPGVQQSSLQTNFRSMQNNFLLLVLGLARLLSVKSLDYQEHASEYGVHWNFFLTVAAVSTLTTIAPIPKPYSLAAGCLVSAIHQLALSWGLIDVVHADERGPQLWHLNKEGLLSVPGYWALSLLSTGLSRHLHPQLQAQNPGTKATRLSGRQAWLWLGRLVVVAAVLWGTLFVVLHWVQPVSRRACNHLDYTATIYNSSLAPSKPAAM